MSENIPTSEVLYRAADLIEGRGWVGGVEPAFNPWGGGEGVPLCLEGAIVEAYAPSEWVRKTSYANLCPAGRAVREHLNMGDWDDSGDVPHLYRFNDTEGRTAAEVIEVLRACAVIEAAKENADVRESVTVR